MSIHAIRFTSSRLGLLVVASLGMALSLGSGAASVHADASDAEIVASASGLRSASGVVRFALYARDGEWLSHDTVASCVAHVHGDDARCSLGRHAAGTYAIAVLHDEDGDGDMDRDFIGIPQEGYGFSSGARPGFGPPSFDDAAFDHGTARTVVAVQARYGI